MANFAHFWRARAFSHVNAALWTEHISLLHNCADFIVQSRDFFLSLQRPNFFQGDFFPPLRFPRVLFLAVNGKGLSLLRHRRTFFLLRRRKFRQLAHFCQGQRFHFAIFFCQLLLLAFPEMIVDSLQSAELEDLGGIGEVGPGHPRVLLTLTVLGHVC